MAKTAMVVILVNAWHDIDLISRHPFYNCNRVVSVMELVDALDSKFASTPLAQAA